VNWLLAHIHRLPGGFFQERVQIIRQHAQPAPVVNKLNKLNNQIVVFFRYGFTSKMFGPTGFRPVVAADSTACK
jgi:hypothetical protein